MRRWLPLCWLLMLAACPDEPGLADAAAAADARADAGRPADAAPRDAEPADAAPADAPAGDAPALDAAVPDADPADADPADADPADAVPGDSGATDGAVGCNYVDVDDRVVQCPAGYSYVRFFQDPAQPGACPDFYELLGFQSPTQAGAIAGAGCSPACIYAPMTSVSFIDHCGRRNGYIRFTAPGCPDIYEFSTGFYLSQAAWEADTPCGG